MNGMNQDPIDLLPEILVLLGAVVGLLIGLVRARDRQRVVAWVCGLFLVAAMVATVVPRAYTLAFDSYRVDLLTNVTRGVVAFSTLLVVVLAAGWARLHERETEVYTLLLLAALGTIMLAGADDLLVLVAAYLLASLPAYTLAGFAKDRLGTEAALKYYLMGAFLGVLMLAGVTLVYGLSGVTGYAALGERLKDAPAPAVAVAVVALMAGLLFKMGAVPAHFWVPDVTQGSTRVVAAFVTTVPKIGAFVALYRLAQEVLLHTGVDWRLLLAVVATATMTLGNLAAFHQDDVRRLLAYSTISQAGYLLLPVVVVGRSDLALPGLLFYLAAYAITNIGAFAVVVAAGTDSLAAYRGLSRRSPGLAISLAVCLLGLVGTPPTAVFVGKVMIFAGAWNGGYAWLAVAAVLNTVASLFYYLRWLRPVFTRGEEAQAVQAKGAVAIAYLAAVLSLLLGLSSGLVLAIT